MPKDKGKHLGWYKDKKGKPTEEPEPIPEPIPESVPEPEPLLCPEPISGTLKYQYNQVGEIGNTVAFAYLGSDYKTHLNVEGEVRKDYLLSGVILNSYTKVVLTSPEDVWVAYGWPLKVSHYQIAGDGITLISSLAIGDSASRLGGFIRLASGRLLIVWHQHIRWLEGITIGWAYTNSQGEWVTQSLWLPDIQFVSNNPATRMTVCQHPDGNIWCFLTRDGHGYMSAIKLVESGDDVVVAQVFNPLIQRKELVFGVEGELPWVASVATSDGILVAYQNKTYSFLSTDPFVKGAHINVIKVLANGSYSLVYEVPEWVERANPILLGKDWVAYGRVNLIDLNWNDLVIYKNGQSTLLGDLAKGVPRNQATEICNSSNWIIAQMNNKLIHFYGR